MDSKLVYRTTDLIDCTEATVRHDPSRRAFSCSLLDLNNGNFIRTIVIHYDDTLPGMGRDASLTLAVQKVQHWTTPVTVGGN